MPILSTKLLNQIDVDQYSVDNGFCKCCLSARESSPSSTFSEISSYSRFESKIDFKQFVNSFHCNDNRDIAMRDQCNRHSTIIEPENFQNSIFHSTLIDSEQLKQKEVYKNLQENINNNNSPVLHKHRDLKIFQANTEQQQVQENTDHLLEYLLLNQQISKKFGFINLNSTDIYTKNDCDSNLLYFYNKLQQNASSRQNYNCNFQNQKTLNKSKLKFENCNTNVNLNKTNKLATKNLNNSKYLNKISKNKKMRSNNSTESIPVSQSKQSMSSSCGETVSSLDNTSNTSSIAEATPQLQTQDLKQKAQQKPSKLFSLNARNLFKYFTKTAQQKQTSVSTSSVDSVINSVPKQPVTQKKIDTHQRSKAKTQFKQIQVALTKSSSLAANCTENSYGFTVVGYCPCQIGKIEKDSIAESFGLMQGDLIIKINGKNVSRATCDSIVKIIKNSSQPLVLDLFRQVSKSSSTKLTKPEPESHKVRNYNYYEKIQQHKLDSFNGLVQTSASTQHTSSSSNNQLHYVVNSTENDMQYNNEYNHLNQFSNLISSNLTRSKKQTTPQKHNNDDYSVRSSMPSPIPHMSSLKEKKSSITDSDYKTQSSTTDNDAATISSSLSNLPTTDSDDHLGSCEKLLNLEEKFIDLMQKGVQQYSRPLRHCMMINTVQHYSLFQNIEKILAISEYQLNQLISQDDSILLDMFNTIGKLYENKMRMSCEAFDIYLNGIENSFNLLSSLINQSSSSPNLGKFLYESQDDIDMDLKTFLLLPLYYVGEIYECLRQIKERTSTKTSDFQFLSNLTNGLEAYVKKASLILNKHNNGQAKNPMRNLDLEQEDEEKEVEQVQKPSLNLVYSSCVQYRQSCNKWKRVRMLFFEDRIILLSYHSNVDKFMSILGSSGTSASILDSLNEFTFKSIMFSDFLNTDFDLDMKQFEFNLNYSRSNGNSSKQHKIKLKCSSNEDKLKWNKLFNKYLNRMI